jgi:hypothetical protein
MTHNHIVKMLGMVIAIAFLPFIAFAQSRFGGGIVLGMNAAQILGDEAAGYNKIGLNAGLRGTVKLNETGKLLLSTELLYSQRGARSTLNDPTPIRTADLNYIEIPVMLSFLDWAKTTSSGATYYKVHFSAGLSYGNLFRAQLSETFKLTHKTLAPSNLAKNDYAYTLGLSYYVNSHWYFTWRYTKSFNWLFNPDNFKDNLDLNDRNALRGYFLTFQTGWLF